MNDTLATLHLANGQGQLVVTTDTDADNWPEFAIWCHHAAQVVAEEVAAFSQARPWEVSIRLASNSSVHKLNAQFRGHDKPTNILSFPNDDDGLEGRWNVGDLILATPTVVAEAKATDRPLANHVQHLLVHGLLHLIGYDHMTPDETHIMEHLEIRLLAKLNIPNPYAELDA